MRRIPGLLAPFTFVACGLLLATPLEAQSGTTAVVSGTISSAAGRPLSGSLITLSSLEGGGTREAVADGTGAFRFALLAPGSYEVRVEALGYRPVVARTLSLAGGTRATVDLTLEQAPPPVLTVDTVAISATSASRFTAVGLRLGARDLEEIPQRHQEFSSLAALDPRLDASLGAQGLPGSMSLTVVDGIPVYRTPHPVARAEQMSGPAFPRSALSGVAVGIAPDVDWGGSAVAQIGLTTLTGAPDDGLSLEGAWSGSPLWTSSQLEFSTPDLLSFEGAGRTTFPVSPGASRIVVAGDVLRRDTPLTPRVSETAAAGLAGIDTDLVASLLEPSVESYSRYSGLLRFDSQTPTSHLLLRGAAGYAIREFDGPGPVALTPGAGLPEESIQYSFAGSYTREIDRDLSFEFRGGVSGGTRTFDPDEGGTPAAYLLDSQSSLGALPAGAGESSRTDVLLSPVLSRAAGNGTLRFGANVRVSRHSIMESRPTEYFFSDGPSLVAGQGYFDAVSAPKVSFTTPEIGAFIRYETALSPRLRTSVGLRFDYEWTPGDVTLNTAWLQASGLQNTDYRKRLPQFGMHGDLSWDPDASTRLNAAVSMHHGDVDSRSMAQVVARDVDATQAVFAGTGLAWPGGTTAPGSATRPTITLWGADPRAPRSIGATIGLVRDFFRGWSAHLGASFRRTDFLLRRRNLNTPTTPQAADPAGRATYGTLQQDGSLVTATGTDALRFSQFNTVWALDPDGWSEYLGLTGGLEYASGTFDLFTSYTYSETTDNWIGAGTATDGAESQPLLPDATWAEGTSDFDVPHRITVGGTAHVSLATLSVAYRFHSGRPFTPGFQDGVDANGDGAVRNDVAFVDAAMVDPLLTDWPCLADQVGGFAVRNSCRGPSVHSVDVRVRFRVGRIGGREASLVIDGFNLIESEGGVFDDALLLVDPSSGITTSPDGSVVTIPFTTNPDFGRILYNTSRGRMIRVGFRIG